MKREEKLALLKGISEGILTKEHLKLPQVYIFIENFFNAPEDFSKYSYEMNGKKYSDQERNEFIAKIDQKNKAILELDDYKILKNHTDFCITVLFKHTLNKKL